MTTLDIRALYHEVYRVARINARHSAYERPDAFDIFRGLEAAASRGVRFAGVDAMSRYDRAYNAGCAAASTRVDPLARPFPWDNVGDEFPFAVLTVRHGLDRSTLKATFCGRLQRPDGERRATRRLP